jgi:hypothetical protein
VTPIDLLNAAKKCRDAAAVIGEQAERAGAANVATQGANLATPIFVATTSVCGDVKTSLLNLQKWYLEHAEALEDAATGHSTDDDFSARRFDKTIEA